MRLNCYFQRALMALCVLSLWACSTPACRKWIFLESGRTCNPEFRIGRLLLTPDAPNGKLELEMDRGRSGLRMYLNLFLFRASSLPEDPSKTSMDMILESGETLTFYLYRLEGGQRMLFPPEVMEYIIKLLSEGQPFTLKLGRYQINVILDNFEEAYQNLMELPIIEEVPES